MKTMWDSLYRFDQLNVAQISLSGKTGMVKNSDVIKNFNDIFKERTNALKECEIPCVGEELLMRLRTIVQRHINDHLLRVLIEQYGRERIDHSKSEAQHYGEALTISKGNNASNDKNSSFHFRDWIDAIISDASKKYDVNAELIRAVIKTESDFNTTSISGKGAMGLMQLMPETAKDMGVENAFDPRENIMGGTRYLKILLDRYGGDVDVALSAYNWGMGNVEKNPERMPEETKSYIVKVKKMFAGSLSQRQTA